MATHTPTDPVSTMVTAAQNSGTFATVESENLSQEYTDYPVCAIDPTEEEDQSDEEDIGRRIHQEQVDYLVHLISHKDQNNARSANDALRDDFLDQLITDTSSTAEGGRYDKVRRTRIETTIGSDEVYITTLVIRVLRTSEYG